MATKHILYEGVLNDDYAIVEEDGSVLITYYTYATEWSNNQHEKACYDLGRAMRWYRDKFSSRVFEQGKRWIEEDTDNYDCINDTPEEYWTMVVSEQSMEI